MCTASGPCATTLTACLLAILWLAGCGKSKPTSGPPDSATPAAPSQAFSKLTGKWQRTDGGYILDIRNILPGGRMEAVYLNPNPIHVAKAEASANGPSPKVFVELRDTNYPGCTYALTFDPKTDQLAGIYFQASMGQQFDVVFERIR